MFVSILSFSGSKLENEGEFFNLFTLVSGGFWLHCNPFKFLLSRQNFNIKKQKNAFEISYVPHLKQPGR